MIPVNPIGLAMVFALSAIAPAPTVYGTQQECEQKTGKHCQYVMCDYVPAGKTFAEVCGKDFQKGWVPNNLPADSAAPAVTTEAP